MNHMCIFNHKGTEKGFDFAFLIKTLSLDPTKNWQKMQVSRKAVYALPL
jgi:hypothetical protein